MDPAPDRLGYARGQRLKAPCKVARRAFLDVDHVTGACHVVLAIPAADRSSGSTRRRADARAGPARPRRVGRGSWRPRPRVTRAALARPEHGRVRARPADPPRPAADLDRLRARLPGLHQRPEHGPRSQPTRRPRTPTPGSTATARSIASYRQQILQDAKRHQLHPADERRHAGDRRPIPTFSGMERRRHGDRPDHLRLRRDHAGHLEHRRRDRPRWPARPRSRCGPG